MTELINELLDSFYKTAASGYSKPIDIHVCTWCDDKFIFLKYEDKKGRKYCSQECKDEQLNEEKVYCEYCKESTLDPVYDEGIEANFCSDDCNDNFRAGPWKQHEADLDFNTYYDKYEL